MAKRLLTAEEKSRIVQERCSEAVNAHPDKMIFVRVEDETDENGQAIVWVQSVGETQSKSGIATHHALERGRGVIRIRRSQ